MRLNLSCGVVTCGLIGVLVVAATAMSSAQGEFPFTRERGRAAVEYRNNEIQIVAAYYYSQQNHDSRWLMIEAAVSASQLTTIPRTAFSIRTPEGREILLASQQRFGQDVERVRLLLQNAEVTTHPVTSYFTERYWTDRMRFFRLPFDGVVHDDFVVDDHRVVAGPLFFESPTGAWEDGTYSLILRHERGQAELPIVLD